MIKPSTIDHGRKNPDWHTIISRERKTKLILDPSINYGVPIQSRGLSPPLLRKYASDIRHFLKVLALSAPEREAALVLIRLFAYYGEVYPKASQVAKQAGSSRRSFWRMVKKLEGMGLMEVVNRYLRREARQQTSNLYLLDKLIAAIIRFIGERSARFLKTLSPALEKVLALSWPEFWTLPQFSLPRIPTQP